MKKRVYSLLLALVFMLSSSVAFAEPIEDSGMRAWREYLYEVFGTDFMRNQERSLEIYMQLQEAFAQDAARGGDRHPDFYGGAYIDDDVSFRFVDISYEELNREFDLMSEIVWNAFEAGCVYAYNIGSCGTNPRDGRIDVWVLDLSEEMIAGFRANIYDSPMLYFMQGGRIVGNEPGGGPFHDVGPNVASADSKCNDCGNSYISNFYYRGNNQSHFETSEAAQSVDFEPFGANRLNPGG